MIKKNNDFSDISINKMVKQNYLTVITLIQ